MQIGTILRNRYKIIKLLGSGGFGETYLGEDLDIPTNPKPKCVVKHLRPQSNNPAVVQIAQNLFNREAEVLYRLGKLHSQIPELYAYFEERQQFYLVQEFIDGEDLSKDLSPGKRWDEDNVKQLLQDILTILTFVHEQNIIHRDIKPANLMRRNDSDEIILIDFGAVKQTMAVNTQGQTKLTVTIGTVGYMPSEQAAGKPKLCSDIYAVGMLGIYALTGIQPHELPKDPNTEEVIWRNWASISNEFANVLDRMVLYHFSQRYQNAAEALQALTQVQINTQPPNQPIQPTQVIPRRKVLGTLVGFGVGSGLAVVGGKLLQGNPSQQQQTSSNTPTEAPAVSTQTKSNKLSLATFPFETVTVDARGNITKRQNQEAKYFVEDLGNGVTLEMVQIPGGTFTMGSPATEATRNNNESPQHQVTVPTFFMGRYQVTQAQYQAIVGNNPSLFKGDNRPVEQVSWNDAVEFCKQLNQKTKRNYRLPSEAEWEYACRALTLTPFYFGETITTDLVNYYGTLAYGSAPKGVYRQQTTEVGKFPPNAFGLYDMHGNVLEWCQDYWHDNYQSAPTDGSAWLTGGDNTRRLLRGGSWLDVPGNCRSADRNRYAPAFRSGGIGFRLVVVLA
jgi:formylglycine-generating enzyme required for sulfatase activity